MSVRQYGFKDGCNAIGVDERAAAGNSPFTVAALGTVEIADIGNPVLARIAVLRRHAMIGDGIMFGEGEFGLDFNQQVQDFMNDRGVLRQVRLAMFTKGLPADAGSFGG